MHRRLRGDVELERDAIVALDAAHEHVGDAGERVCLARLLAQPRNLAFGERGLTCRAIDKAAGGENFRPLTDRDIEKVGRDAPILVEIAGACIAQLAPDLSASLLDTLTLTPGGGESPSATGSVLHVAQPAAESTGAVAGSA